MSVTDVKQRITQATLEKHNEETRLTHNALLRGSLKAELGKNGADRSDL